MMMPGQDEDQGEEEETWDLEFACQWSRLFA